MDDEQVEKSARNRRSCRSPSLNDLSRVKIHVFLRRSNNAIARRVAVNRSIVLVPFESVANGLVCRPRIDPVTQT